MTQQSQIQDAEIIQDSENSIHFADMLGNMEDDIKIMVQRLKKDPDDIAAIMPIMRQLGEAFPAFLDWISDVEEQFDQQDLALEGFSSYIEQTASTPNPAQNRPSSIDGERVFYVTEQQINALGEYLNHVHEMPGVPDPVAHNAKALMSMLAHVLQQQIAG